MRKLSLVFGGDYDRTRLLQRDEVRARWGLDVDLRHVPIPHEAFAALTHTDEFDGGEMSLSFLSSMLSNPSYAGDLVALPVFISRMFRHGNVLVRRDAGVRRPQDLVGRTFGVNEYGVTMAVWMRGILSDEYGVRPSDLSWRTVRDPVALNDDLLRYPDGLDIRRSKHETLIEALCAGEIDAMVGLVPRRLPDDVERLFPAYWQTEQAFYRRTQVFPIMHVLVLRRRVVEEDPDLLRDLYEACGWAKNAALDALRDDDVLSVAMPNVLAAMDDLRALMGDDIWPYGIEPNLPTLATFLRYAGDQGLLWSPLQPRDLFASATGGTR